MRSARYFRLLDALDEVVVTSPPSADDHPHATIASGYKRVRNRLKAAQDAATDHDREDALHRVRKAAKRLRYVAAATGAKKVADRAKATQRLRFIDTYRSYIINYGLGRDVVQAWVERQGPNRWDAMETLLSSQILPADID